jgi:hypothetical protein
MADVFKKLAQNEDFNDAGIKNVFCWRWFEESVDGESVGSWARKVAKAGYANLVVLALGCGNMANL